MSPPPTTTKRRKNSLSTDEEKDEEENDGSSDSAMIIVNDDDDDDDDDEGTLDTCRHDRRQDHHHCYLIRSLDPKHPRKTYIGYTVDPHRRLRQHNGILKNGGAWRTRKNGRPWTFSCIVEGFPSQRKALQFEWAWQHIDKSHFVTNAVGDVPARSLFRKQGVKGRLQRLKTLVVETISDLYSHPLAIYFFDPEDQAHFLHATTPNHESLLPPGTKTYVIDRVEAMPFWSSRGSSGSSSKKKKNNKNKNKKKTTTNREDGPDSQSSSEEKDDEIGIASQSFDDPKICSLCSRPFVAVGHDHDHDDDHDDNEGVTCASCSKSFHNSCAEIDPQAQNGVCPQCKGNLGWEYDSADDGWSAVASSSSAVVGRGLVEGDGDQSLVAMDASVVGSGHALDDDDDDDDSGEIEMLSSKLSHHSVSSSPGVSHSTQPQLLQGTEPPRHDLPSEPPIISFSRSSSSSNDSDSDSDFPSSPSKPRHGSTGSNPARVRKKKYVIESESSNDEMVLEGGHLVTEFDTRASADFHTTGNRIAEDVSKKKKSPPPQPTGDVETTTVQNDNQCIDLCSDEDSSFGPSSPVSRRRPAF